jgi:thymidylate kinase
VRPSGIIVVEGADGSGKTTLIDHLVKHHGARRMHSVAKRNHVLWDAGMVRRGERLVGQGELAVFDRHWVTELVYGPIFRGSTAYSNETAADFDERIRCAPGVYVLCVPTDARKHLERFEALKSQRSEAFQSIEQVVQRYQDLLHGNVAHPGGNLVDMFIRFGDFTRGRRVHHYDIDAPRCNVREAARNILKLLRS